MSKRDRTIERLDELATLKSVSDPAVLLEKLRHAMDDKTNLVVAKAAQIATARDVRGVADRLLPAFDRFMASPEKTDPGCAAKTAIVQAMIKFQLDDRGVFLRGLRHRQYEPVWGGSKDTAAKLRGLVGSSRVDLQACKLEYSIVSPK